MSTNNKKVELKGNYGIDIYLYDDNKDYISISDKQDVMLRCNGQVIAFDSDKSLTGFEKLVKAINKAKANYTFEDAVDAICLECDSIEEACDNCPVRIKVKTKKAFDYLEKTAKEKNAEFYEIVEDSYIYDNGLVLIIYKDKEHEVEIENVTVNIDEF